MLEREPKELQNKVDKHGQFEKPQENRENLSSGVFLDIESQKELERKIKAPRIHIEAPPWIPIPPPEGRYGGIEAVIDLQIQEFKKRGLPVPVLNANLGSIATAERHGVYHEEVERFMHDKEISTLVESYHSLYSITRIVTEIGEGRRKPDIIHIHSRYIGPSIFAAVRHSLEVFGHEFPPILVTIHGAFSTAGVPQDQRLYDLIKDINGVYINSISDSQIDYGLPGLRLSDAYVGTVYNGIPVEKFTFRGGGKKEDFLLSLSRIDPDKGQDLAIQVAKEVGLPLIIAGPVHSEKYFKEEIEPQLTEKGKKGERYIFSETDTPQLQERKLHAVLDLVKRKKDSIVFVGPVNFKIKNELYSRAYSFLFPIQWEEPFGLVMIEAMACGTPVVALRRGSVPELVSHNHSGFVAWDIDEMVNFLKKDITKLEPVKIRRYVQEKFNGRQMVEGYLEKYRKIFELEEAKKGKKPNIS